MSTIKSSAENLTLNADGANNDIKFQSNGSEVASIDQAGVMTATSFAGSGASLTNLPVQKPSITDGGNATAITIDSAENVGIGVTPESSLSSQTALQVGGTGVITSSTTAASGADTHYGQNAYLNTSGDWAYQVTDEATLISQNDGNLRFRVAASGSADAAITWDTAFTISQTGITPTTSQGHILTADGSGTYSRNFRNSTSETSHQQFYNPNGLVGKITTSGSGTSFTSLSDYRLKENVDYDWDATTRLKQLKPARFNFIADDTTTVDGFIAHEAATVVPECVTGAKDAMRDETDEEGNVTSVPDMQGIDQSKLVPLLVKTIQELEARITALEG